MLNLNGEGLITLILVVIFAIWNFSITFILLKVIKHYRNLTIGLKKGNLDKILETILHDIEKERLCNKKANEAIENLGEEAKYCFKKMGLVKYNPFAELGGNQSFSLALLDGLNSGCVVTGLHSRDSTRVYIKAVKDGVVINGELSKEEASAIKEAKENACSGKVKKEK